MSVTVAELDRWDPQALRDVAAAATVRARSAEEAAGALTLLPALAQWDGVAASAARLSIAATLTELDRHAQEARAVAAAADQAATAVAALKADLRNLENAAHAGFLDIDHGSGAVRPAPGFTGTPAQLEAAGWVTLRLAGILERADAVDTELAQAISRATSTEPTPGTAPGPRDSADPGNLDGVPVADRDVANRAALQADLRRVTDVAAAHRVPVEEVTADPERFGLDSTAVTRYTNALRVSEGLENAVLRTGVPALLWIYNPEAFGGRGRAAIAIGNPDLAADTAVVVPGTGNSVAAGWLSDDDAANLFNELALAEPGVAHSVIAWMGYETPTSLADPRVAQPGLARRGAALLAADVRALAATHVGPPAHVTVIGHSYGSTTVADAAAGAGMRVDDVVLIGCPGTDLAGSAADFHLPRSGHVFVGSTSTDPVTAFAGIDGLALVGGRPVEVGLGADPAADGFGSTRFKAEVPGWTWNAAAEHSAYYGDGSESLYSMADIASGHGDLLEQHGMTAPHRDGILGPLATALGLPSWSVPLTDPEFGRAGTDGHRH